MSAPTVALPTVTAPAVTARRGPVRSRPTPGVRRPPAEAAGPVTVTISVGAADPDRRARLLTALADLIEAAGPAAGHPGAAPVPAAPSAPGDGAGRPVTDGPRVDGPAAAVAVCLDAGPRSVTRGGRPVELSRREYDLLSFFAGHPRRVFTRTRLLHEVWGGAYPGPRTVDVHVSRLRRKLGAGHDVIDTVRGIGYRLADEAPVVTIPV